MYQRGGGMRIAGVLVFFSLLAIGFGPFGVVSAFAALQLWTWFASPILHMASPTFEQMYFVFAIIGFFRAARYVKDGRLDWKDAVIGSVLSPGLLLLAGFLIHVGAKRF
jgi:hypothetical protein